MTPRSADGLGVGLGWGLGWGLGVGGWGLRGMHVRGSPARLHETVDGHGVDTPLAHRLFALLEGVGVHAKLQPVRAMLVEPGEHMGRALPPAENRGRYAPTTQP